MYISINNSGANFSGVNSEADLYFVEKTEKKNAVLIYLAKKDKKLAIIGDEGINKVVPANFWDDERASFASLGPR